jgi:hypothetical protein
MNFQKFNKIPRLSRDVVVTEKIDGTNAQVVIIEEQDLYQQCSDWEKSLQEERFHEFVENYSLALKRDIYGSSPRTLHLFAGSRNRWLNIKKDNHGFAKWVLANMTGLFQLGEGRHFGEFYGAGIQRTYGLSEKRFALFNVSRWANRNVPESMLEEKQEWCPECCEVVPFIYQGVFDTCKIDSIILDLKVKGSRAVPGFMKPEGIIILHCASNQLYKKTLDNDYKPKGCNAE